MSQGVSVAWGSHAYSASPSYTRMDDATRTALGLNITGWHTKRGRNYFTDKTQPGIAGVDFVDQGGVLDPTNTGGPFFPMDPNCPLQLSLYDPTRSTWTTVYTGLVESMPTTLDTSERFSRGTLNAVDMMSLLAIAEVPPGLDYAAQTPGSYSASTSSNNIGDTTYAAQYVDDRIRALLADAGVPSALTDIFSGNVSVRRSTEPPGASILEQIMNAADAEFPGVANVYVSKLGLLTFHGRLARFNPSNPSYGINTWHVGDVAAVNSHPSWGLISGLTFDRDVQKVINASLWAPDGIADVDIPKQLAKNLTSIAQYGNRAYSGMNLITNAGNTDGRDGNRETQLYGQYFVDNFPNAQTRISQLTLKAPRPGAANESAQYLMLCGVEISDIVYVSTTHRGGGGFNNQEYFVEGISYEVRPGGNPLRPLITMTLDLSPAAYVPNGYFPR